MNLREPPIKNSIQATSDSPSRQETRRWRWLWLLPLLSWTVGWQGSLHAASSLQFSSGTYATQEGVPEVEVTVQRTGGDLSVPTTVEVQAAVGTAVFGSDYLFTGTTLTFDPQVVSKTLRLRVLNDGAIELVKSLRLFLTNAGPGSVLGVRSSATVQISDNDKALQLEQTNYSLSEEAGVCRVRVVRRDDGEFPLSVEFATSNVTAVAGIDYEPIVGNVTFAPGEAVKTLLIPLLNDAEPETNKVFRIHLSNISMAGMLAAPSLSTVTLTNEDEVVSFRSGTFSVSEEAAVARVALVRGESARSGSVEVRTEDGTARAGEDYVAVTNVVEFAPGERLRFLEVAILQDGVREAAESFRLTLNNPSGGALVGSGASRTVTATIQDNDPGVGFETATASVENEQAAVELTVKRGNDAWLEPFTVDYRTIDGTAKAGVDYAAAIGTLNFGQNEFVRTIRVELLHPSTQSLPRYFDMALTNSTGSIPSGRLSTRVTVVSSARGVATVVQPGLRSEIVLQGDKVAVSWNGSGAVWRGDKPGMGEPLGTADSPFVSATVLPGAFYEVRSPRPARLYVPASYDGTTAVPLLLVLHGYTGTGQGYVGYFGMETVAEARGVLVCHPDGTKDPSSQGFWNATEACCNFFGSKVDDSAYLRGLIEEIAREYRVDRRRIYVMGHSNGGYMSFRMARDHADLIAGIASLAGATFLDHEAFKPSERVNVLQIHGTADAVVPYAGGFLVGLNQQALFPGAIGTVQTWAALNGASQPEWDPMLRMDLDLNVTGPDTLVMRYANASPGGAVELWTIMGGSHSPGLSSGSRTSEFAAQTLDWLLAHPKP